MPKISLSKIEDSDLDWVTQIWIKDWGDNFIISKGKKYYTQDVSGYIACINDTKVGLITYVIDNSTCEIISLNSFSENAGIGSQLLEKVVEHAKKELCNSIILVTSNDNLNALRFYQKREFRIKSIKTGVIDQYRKIKPSIPETGNWGIPIRDEIELEKVL